MITRRLYHRYDEEHYVARLLSTDVRFPGRGLRLTSRARTGQRDVVGTGLMYYKARYYYPALGRFVSADTIVPGAASGAGGGVTTLGYSDRTRLTPLTVNLSAFVLQINAENREIAQFGAFFQWEARTRREHNVPMGPGNPQALNRYAYVLNNPLRYVDPSGYYAKNTFTLDQLRTLIQLVQDTKEGMTIVGHIGAGGAFVSGLLVAVATANPAPFLAGAAIAGATEIWAGMESTQLECLQDYLEQALSSAEEQGLESVN